MIRELGTLSIFVIFASAIFIEGQPAPCSTVRNDAGVVQTWGRCGNVPTHCRFDYSGLAAVLELRLYEHDEM
jgi:hypothetical protein